MLIELCFATALSSDAGVKAICGPRIYPLRMPNNPTLPAIEYSIITGSSTPTFDSGGPNKRRVEVNCFGDTYSDAVTLRKAVVDALGNYRDDNMTIQSIGPHDLFDDAPLSYRAMQEFYVFSNL
jgi:hypothetical protein